MGKWANGQMGKWANGQMGNLTLLPRAVSVQGEGCIFSAALRSRRGLARILYQHAGTASREVSLEALGLRRAPATTWQRLLVVPSGLPALVMPSHALRDSQGE